MGDIKKGSVQIRSVTNGNSFVFDIHELHNLDLKLARYRDTVHWHDHFELEILEKGEAIHLVNCQSYRIKKYDAYLVTPADIHTLHVHPDHPSGIVDVIHLSFNESAISENLFNENSEIKRRD